MLEDYFAEFSALHAQAESVVEELSTLASRREEQSGEACSSRRPSEVSCLHQKLDSLLTKMKRCFSLVELEFRCLSREERTVHQHLFQTCRRQLDLLQRKALLAGGGEGERRGAGRSSSSSSVAARHRSTTEALQQGNLLLSQSCRVASETNALGESALCSLYIQRETISRSLSRTKEVQQNMKEADTLVTKMSRWWNGIW